jgi:hypothetical protein
MMVCLGWCPASLCTILLMLESVRYVLHFNPQILPSPASPTFLYLQSSPVSIHRRYNWKAAQRRPNSLALGAYHSPTLSLLPIASPPQSSSHYLPSSSKLSSWIWIWNNLSQSSGQTESYWIWIFSVYTFIVLNQ